MVCETNMSNNEYIRTESGLGLSIVAYNGKDRNVHIKLYSPTVDIDWNSSRSVFVVVDIT
jgi:hypothetical protein